MVFRIKQLFCFYIAIIRYHLALQQSPYVQIMNLNSCGMYHNALISVELMALSMDSGTQVCFGFLKI